MAALDDQQGISAVDPVIEALYGQLMMSLPREEAAAAALIR